MMFILFFIFTCIAMLTFILSIIITISWLTHISMTKDSSKIYGYGSYKKFVNEFEKNKLDYDRCFNSFFDTCNGSEFHASIIKFRGIGMLLNPIDWIRANLYIRKKIKLINKKEKYKW